MKRRAWLWTGPGLLALAALAALAMAHRSTDDASSAPMAVASAAASRHDDAELRRMREQLAALHSQMAGVQRSLAGRSDPVQLRERAEAGQRKHHAYLDALRRDFGRERADPAWSPAMTSRLWNAIRADETMREAARDVECRSTLCRIEIRDGGDLRLHKQLPLWSQQFADALPRTVAQYGAGADGGNEMVLYLLGPEPSPAPAAKP